MSVRLGFRISILAVVLAGVSAPFVLNRQSEPATGNSDSRFVEKTARENETSEGQRAESDAGIPLSRRKEMLLRMDRAEAVAWVLEKLESGADFPTGTDLAIGGDQGLSNWPSLRVFLLDMLSILDPATAATVSRKTLETSDSPDEWAVALRNVAKADQQGTATEWLRARTVDLLHNEAWRNSPTAGYLQAFDLIVFTRHTALSPELLEYSEDRNRPAIRHAAFLALDRLVLECPDQMLPLLAQDAGRHPKSGPMISNFIARADVRNEIEREALEAYLLDDARMAAELRGFANVFPNANFHISDNLITKTPMVTGAEIAAKDRATLEIVDRWLRDARFSSIHPWLREVKARLERHVGN